MTFAYDKNPSVKIFDKLDFQVRKTDKIIIRGKSGAGKTTLYKILTSAYPQIFETITSDFVVSFSPQHPLVLPDTETVAENLNPYEISFDPAVFQ